jgi:hypothetical protein
MLKIIQATNNTLLGTQVLELCWTILQKNAHHSVARQDARRYSSAT